MARANRGGHGPLGGRDEDGIVGFVAAGPSRTEEGPGELYAIYVLPEAWGSGAAAGLMAAFKDWLADEGHTSAMLWVLADNPRARRFYEREGWRADGERVDTIRGVEVEEALYRLSSGRRVGALHWRSVIARYSRPEMARIWSDEAKLARWLEVELAALDAGAELGLVPADAARTIRERAQPPSPERVAELEATLHHDTAAFVDAVAETLGPDGRWFHHGLTSSDVVDTGLALQVRAAGELLLEGVDSSAAGGRRTGRGAPADGLHRPHPRDPRGADDVRAQARRLGVRARARTRAAAERARADARRQALGRRRHLRGDRSGARATRVRARSAWSRSPSRRRSCSATDTRSC